ncbi:calmodulin-like protein 12 [Xenia sp. Carnegie-2017]|uniref:calmodulin-like protein 12 n=1 Tax=Xenia sp. Carnegie-2017 TaxID=2897299 RepID=UPI001F04E51C|nr:calmodulin-like protein 12 [Xenia sp. Carnegie-2017]XP_046848665.1 calmodulin-like protein 12 [Xenia sp. Carnegie-2017]
MAAPMNVSASYFDKSVPNVVLRSLFMKYDVDGSGVLNRQELQTLFEGDLGFTHEQAEAYSMMLDKDGNQAVSFEELSHWLASGEKFKNINDKCRFHRLKKAVELFKKFDADGNGAIEKDEFTNLMIAINCPRNKIPEALKSLDSDGDGKISFPEFLNWLNWLPN